MRDDVRGACAGLGIAGVWRVFYNIMQNVVMKWGGCFKTFREMS